MKKVKENMKTNGASDDEIKEFETGAQTFAKKVVGSFKDWEFFTGESMDPDGMIVLLNYREDGSMLYRPEHYNSLFTNIPSSFSDTICVFLYVPLFLSHLFAKLISCREARHVRDEGLSLSKSRQAGCISGLLSFSNYALSYDIHEPNKSTLTFLTPIFSLRCTFM
ncbi:unnamed protein product [Aureobasidium uvarum]|uniref:Translationally-controlled tumor protein homolog n=1 Tax=Aureobasidium uvarum TaxID=2773716 RepID=A0A9N8PPL9_9PEZI|nr:unnamed protein product [Aureobasidium uvarum]